MVLGILEGTQIVFISLGFLGITLLGFIILIFQLWNEGISNALVRNLTRGAIIISIGYVLSIINLILGELYWLNITTQSNFYKMFSSIFYYGGWFFGLRLFLRTTFRLPEERKRIYNIFINVIIGLVALMLVFTLTTWALVNKMGENNPLVIILFVVQGIIGIIVFVVFEKMIRSEINKTASKLSKARFFILRKVVTVQLIIFAVIIIGDVLQLIFVEQLLLLEVLTLVALSILSMITMRLLHGMIYVPEKTKERFGIMDSRFESIKKMVMEE